jgi:hypothetical protein
MEAEITSKTCLPSYQTARRHISEDSNIRTHHLEDIRQHDIVKGKGKAIPLQAWTGPEGSRRLRLPDFKTIGT